MGTRALSTSAEEIFPRNNARKSFVINNEDSSIAMFLKRERAETPSVSSTVHDLRIGPLSVVAVNSLVDGTEAIQDRWTIVAASGTPQVSFFETEDVKR